MIDHSFNEFCRRLNQSPWRGIVTEVGVGLEFSSRYLRVPGASNTILAVECPYDAYGKPPNMRAVSLDNAKRLASENLGETMRRLRIKSDDSEVVEPFGLAITGAHYQDRPSNVWVYVATKKWEAYMHFEVATNADREWVGRMVSSRVQWLLEGCMLSTATTWRERIEEIGDSLGDHNIDVLYAPGVSDAERMLMLRPDNPLAYHMGTFQRVTDIIRTFPMIYPGAFNPPTREHLSATALFELSQHHYYKGGLSIEDMLHRMRMLAAAGKPVLLTQAPRFIDKYALLKRYSPEERFIFLLGVDAWNMTIPHHQYPSERWLAEQMPDVEFWIKPRAGIKLYENGVSKHLKYKVLESDGSDVNSTAVRESEDPASHEYLTPEVAEYIRQRGLYRG